MGESDYQATTTRGDNGWTVVECVGPKKQDNVVYDCNDHPLPQGLQDLSSVLLLPWRILAEHQIATLEENLGARNRAMPIECYLSTSLSPAASGVRSKAFLVAWTPLLYRLLINTCPVLEMLCPC